MTGIIPRHLLYNIRESRRSYMDFKAISAAWAEKVERANRAADDLAKNAPEMGKEIRKKAESAAEHINGCVKKYFNGKGVRNV